MIQDLRDKLMRDIRQAICAIPPEQRIPADILCRHIEPAVDAAIKAFKAKQAVQEPVAVVTQAGAVDGDFVRSPPFLNWLNLPAMTLPVGTKLCVATPASAGTGRGRE